MSPGEHAVSPREQTVSPAEHSESPRKHAASPRRRRVSRREHSLSPRKHAVSPRKHAVSPREHSVSPREHSVSPREQTVSPWEQAVSPWEQAVPPWEPAVSPRRQRVLPRTQVMSLEEQPVFPRRHEPFAGRRSTRGRRALPSSLYAQSACPTPGPRRIPRKHPPERELTPPHGNVESVSIARSPGTPGTLLPNSLRQKLGSVSGPAETPGDTL